MISWSNNTHRLWVAIRGCSHLRPRTLCMGRHKLLLYIWALLLLESKGIVICQHTYVHAHNSLHHLNEVLNFNNKN